MICSSCEEDKEMVEFGYTTRTQGSGKREPHYSCIECRAAYHQERAPATRAKSKLTKQAQVDHAVRYRALLSGRLV